jgi:hypothetical protein
MEPLSLSGNYRIVAGVLLGIIFGFLMVKSKMAWRKTMIDQLFLKNTTFMKTFLVSIAVGSLLFHFAMKYGLVELQFRPIFFWGAVIGGGITAFGLALCGQIPASIFASLATGRLYSIWILIGMLLAMPVVHIVSKFLSKTIYQWPTPFNCPETLQGFFNENIVFWVPGIAIFIVLFLEFVRTDSEDA